MKSVIMRNKHLRDNRYDILAYAIRKVVLDTELSQTQLLNFARKLNKLQGGDSTDKLSLHKIVGFTGSDLKISFDGASLDANLVEASVV